MVLTDCDSQLTERVISCALTVHKDLGPGLLESVYEEALMLELRHRGLEADRQVPVSVTYR